MAADQDPDVVRWGKTVPEFTSAPHLSAVMETTEAYKDRARAAELSGDERPIPNDDEVLVVIRIGLGVAFTSAVNPDPKTWRRGIVPRLRLDTITWADFMAAFLAEEKAGRTPNTDGS